MNNIFGSGFSNYDTFILFGENGVSISNMSHMIDIMSEKSQVISA